jgi:hypothetical protein
VILLQRRWHWWRFTLASVAAIGVVLAVTGPEEALRRHSFVPSTSGSTWPFTSGSARPAPR